MTPARRSHLVLGAALALLISACGLPIDDRVQTFDEVPFDKNPEESIEDLHLQTFNKVKVVL